MTLGYPQMIYLVLTLIGMGVVLVEHGKPSTTNAWITIGSQIFIYWLLFWGVFFQMNPVRSR